MESRIQLYSMNTANGNKISTFLEEAGIPYDAHLIDIRKGDQFQPEFLKINPNNKIPAIVDPEGPNGEPFNVFESGAILIYLAEKYNKFIPSDPLMKAQVLQWLFWQVAGQGPMFGQLGHFFKYAPEKIDYAIERYHKETDRLLKVLDRQLEGHDWVVGDEITIADFAICPWLNTLENSYKYTALPFSEYRNIAAYLKRFMERPGVQRGYLATVAS